MVDKENLWDDDMEYSQEEANDSEFDESASLGDEYSEQGYDEDDYGDYEEDEEADDDDAYGQKPASKNKKNNQLILLIVALLLLGLAGFLVMSKMNSGNQISDSGDTNNSSSMEQTFGGESSQDGLEAGNNVSTQEMGDMFFEQAGGNSSDMMSFDFNNNDGSAQVATNDNEKVATVTDAESNSLSNEDLFGSSDGINISSGTENNDIVVSYDKDKVVRENPFKPPVYVKQKEEHDNKVVVNNTQFEIIEPPTASVPDENLTKILQTQVSGILYDDLSPSAIVNLNGIDTFVKVGDKISGYRIQSITQDKVQVSYKNNSYVASVGELFVKGQLEKQRAVADLEHKFAGRYKNEKAQ